MNPRHHMIFVGRQGVTSKFSNVCLNNLKVPFQTEIFFTDLRGTLGRGWRLMFSNQSCNMDATNPALVCPSFKSVRAYASNSLEIGRHAYIYIRSSVYSIYKVTCTMI